MVSAGLAFGGALNAADTVLLRASVHQHQSNGFRKNPFLQRDDTNGRHETTIRTRMRWLAGHSWDINLAVLHADVDNGYDAFAIDNSYTVLSDRPGKDSQESVGASLRAEYSGRDGVLFTSLTSLADSEIRFSYDADWGNTDSWAPVIYDYWSISDRQRRTVSQELRLTGESWTAGLYGMRLEDDLETFDRGEYYDPFYDFADSLNAEFDSEYAATNIAAFGQFDFALAAATDLSVGLRVERRSTHYRDSAGLQANPAETMLGGEVSLNHEFSANLGGYVTVSRGYKAGGFNLGQVPDDRREFDAEVMWNIEAGIKSGWADDSVQLNTSVFYARRDDQQVRTSFQIDPGDPTSFVFFTDNAARGKTLGLEADLRWLPDTAWDLYVTLGLLEATFDEFVTPQVDLSGRRQAHAPRVSIAAGAGYTHSSGFFARVDWSSRSDFYFDVSHDRKSSAFELLNLRIGYAAVSWSVQAWARNLFDKDYAVRGFYFGNEPPDFPATLYTRFGDPQQLGVTLDVIF
jgi:outer membrane receptor protein involved in Fe transport